MKARELFYKCWLEVSKSQRYHDKWLTDETYYRAIKAQFSTVVSLVFDRGKMNREISTHGGTTLDDFTVLVDSGMKQEATIPLAIPTGMNGDTMLQPQEEK